MSAPDTVEPAHGWRADALCAQTDPDAFFPEKGGNGLDAKATCAACTVRRECLAYALDHEEYGVWGGHTERERKRINRRRQAA